MIIRNSSGRQRFNLLVSVVVCALSTHTAYGWQQEYIVDAMSGHTAERYTWDSDHQPRYNDILEERIRSTKSVAGPVVNLADQTKLDTTSGMSMGWNFPVSRQVTTGPIAALHYDGSATSTYNEFGDSATSVTQTDPLWHASVSTLGWRVNSQFGDVRPWAQISYNQQFGENIW